MNCHNKKRRETMKRQDSKYRVESSHRYNYWGLDLFRGERMERTILAGLKRKDAEILEGEINNLIDKVFAEK